MKTFTLKDPVPLGDKDPKYGQTYWSYTHDQDLPVMFNLMEGEVGDGTVVTTEEWVNKQSAKGTEYMRLKKVKVTGQQAITATHPTNNELVLQKLDEILALLQAPKTSGFDKAKAVRETFSEPDKDVVIEDIGDEPINIDDIPF